jgi:hypothetical protein
MTESPLAHTNAQLTLIEDLIADLSTTDDANRFLLREHMQSARGYLLGAMPVEYAASLELAQKAIQGFADKRLRRRLKQEIAELTERQSHATAAAISAE